jgi:hypothetical protein
MIEPRPGRYRHYKGNEYIVIGIARHSETHESMVVYHALHDASEIWVRPRDMFISSVVADGRSQPRFRCLEVEDGSPTF